MNWVNSVHKQWIKVMFEGVINIIIPGGFWFLFVFYNKWIKCNILKIHVVSYNSISLLLKLTATLLFHCFMGLFNKSSLPIQKLYLKIFSKYLLPFNSFNMVQLQFIGQLKINFQICQSLPHKYICVFHFIHHYANLFIFQKRKLISIYTLTFITGIN